MIRQRALAWAAVLALAATVSMTPFPARFSAPTASALVQGDSAADAGEPADLAIVALHCAEAPATEALTSFLTTGAAPSECAPAVGVTISVHENGAPAPGSPFATDIAGTVVLPVGLGSAVEVTEDPRSLPTGYEPITQETNGVPYANPVQIDSAMAGAAVLFVNLPRSAATELAQDVPAAEVGEPINLAVAALQCADAPGAETLTSFFRSGTPPSGCAPAVGVRVAVMENENPLPGSPFTTDADGALAVPVSLGSAVKVRVDPRSLPSGYEPLTRQANGVPYANPVQIDSATADAAVLFVNVPASVAARLANDPLAVGAGGGANLADAVTADRTGCDPAYPDERTCIAPGRPLAAPCSITDQRNFTVLSPDPRGLDADRDGIGCEPISPRGGTIARDASVTLYRSGGNIRRAAPARTGGVALASSQAQTVRVSPPVSNRGDPLVVHRDRSRADLWFVVPSRPSTGNVAIASNPVLITSGLWGWPNRINQDDWIWRSRNHHQSGVRSRPSAINFGSVTVAGAGSGNVAIASNPVFISRGVWHWSGHSRNDGWIWNHGMKNGQWRWPNRFGNSVWGWPRAISVGNLAIARSGDSIAIVSNPIVIIASGLWFVPTDRNHDWFDHDDRDHGDRDHVDAQRMQSGSTQTGPTDVEAQAIDGGLASDLPSGRIGPTAASDQLTLAVNGGFAVEPARSDSMRSPSDGAVEPLTEGAVESPGAVAVAAPLDTALQPPADAGAPDASYVAPDPSTINTGSVDAGDVDAGHVAPDAGVDLGYVAPEPAVDPGYVDPGYVEPSYVEQEPTYGESDGDPGYVAPEPSYVEPSYVDPGYVDAGTVDPGYVAPDPVNEPSYSAPEPSYVDPGTDANYVAPEPNYVAPEPSYVAPEPSYVDGGNGAANSGMDAGFGGQDAGNIAPEPNFADPGMDAGFIDAGNAGAGNMAPDAGMDAAGNVDAGSGAPDSGGVGGGRNGHENQD